LDGSMVRGHEAVSYNQNSAFMYKQRQMKMRKGFSEKTLPDRLKADAVLDKGMLKGELDLILQGSEKKLNSMVSKSQIISANKSLSKKHLLGKDGYQRDYEPKYKYLNQSNTKNHGSY
jgi:hypothetical protein